MRKYKLTNNLSLKIVAFIFSAFLWLIVVNLDNPVGSQTFTNIPVTILNEDIIFSAGDVYQVVGEEQVSVVVYANREIRQDLSAEDIVATADVAEMDTSTGLIPVTISIPEYSGKYESAEAVPRNIRIQREKSGRKVLALTVETEEEQRDGYVLSDMTVHPENVTITGAESLLDQIDRAAAKINIGGISKSEELVADLVLYDADNNELSQSQLDNNLGEDGLTVSVEVLPKKSVPVVADASGRPANGYQYTGCTVEPESVQIYGESDDIDDIEEIHIPAAVLDITGAVAPVEQNIDITPYLPDGVKLVDEKSGTVKVSVMIEQEGTRTITMLVSSIKMNDLADGFQVSFEPDAEITLQFSGDQDALDILNISNAVSVDLSAYTKAGTYNVPVKVNVPNGITLTSEVTVALTIEEKKDEVPGNESAGDTETSEDGNEQDTTE